MREIKDKILIIGHARHGKDTVAEIAKRLFGLKFESSSQAACRIFLFDALKNKYGYKTSNECFEDRINHRVEWHNLICEYNHLDKARLAKEILRDSDIYVGMRSYDEVHACLAQGVFKAIIGVFDPRKPLESANSFNIDLWASADIVIPNGSSLSDLENKVYLVFKNL